MAHTKKNNKENVKENLLENENYNNSTINDCTEKILNELEKLNEI